MSTVPGRISLTHELDTAAGTILLPDDNAVEGARGDVMQAEQAAPVDVER